MDEFVVAYTALAKPCFAQCCKNYRKKLEKALKLDFKLERQWQMKLLRPEKEDKKVSEKQWKSDLTEWTELTRPEGLRLADDRNV